MLCSVQIVESPKKQYDFVISCLICVVFPHFNLKVLCSVQKQCDL